jgi:hypothetical protein
MKQLAAHEVLLSFVATEVQEKVISDDNVCTSVFAT